MPKMTDEQLEALGNKLAADCSFSGDWILKAFAAALTQANYHNEAEVVEQMLAAVDATDNTPEYRLTVLSGDEA
jgi:hypothetical protein